jgi:putative transposase
VAPDLRRQLGISERTYFRWKAKYGGIETRGAKKLKLEDENPKLKQLRPN